MGGRKEEEEEEGGREVGEGESFKRDADFPAVCY